MRLVNILVTILFVSLTAVVIGEQNEPNDISAYFGFGEMEIIKLKRDISGLNIADFNGDNRNDIVIANNREGEPTKMIVPVGPTQQYPEFAQIVNDERIDCRNLWTFNMDEYLTW